MTLPNCHPHKIAEQITNRYDFTVETGSNKNWKLQRTVTDYGICYTFNSEIARYISPEYLLYGILPPYQELYVVNFFDKRKFVILGDLRSAYVWEKLSQRQYSETILLTKKKKQVFVHGPNEVKTRGALIQVKEFPATYTTLQLDAITILSSPSIRNLLYRQRRCR